MITNVQVSSMRLGTAQVGSVVMSPSRDFFCAAVRVIKQTDIGKVLIHKEGRPHHISVARTRAGLLGLF